ncbi:MAG: hypothetical protein BWY76_02835 [bacterium ADurb.Bin429]|nr:MAG: hypothetical protein BWY76_02835 [bacterium ADurb.Bin429]
MYHKLAAPFPTAIVILAAAGGQPAEDKAPLAVTGGLRGVVRAAVKSVVGGRQPETGQRPAHAIMGHAALGERRVDEIPPVADAEEVGALVCVIFIWPPERFAHLPDFQIRTGGQRRAASVATWTIRLSRSQQHPVFASFVVPENEGVAPVVRFVSRRRFEPEAIILRPGFQVETDGVHHPLHRKTRCLPVVVVPGVEDMKLPLRRDDAAGEDIQIAALYRPPRQRLAPLFESDEILRDDLKPRRSLSMPLTVAVILQIEEVVAPVMIEGNEIGGDAVGWTIEDGHGVLLARFIRRLFHAPSLPNHPLSYYHTLSAVRKEPGDAPSVMVQPPALPWRAGHA